MLTAKSLRHACCVLAAWCVVSQAAGAQSGMPVGTGYNAALARLFGDVKVFSAEAEATMTSPEDGSRLTLPMRFQVADGRIRVDTDLARVKGTVSSLQGLPSLQNIGLARVATVVLPGEKRMLVLYPDVKFYTRVNLSEEDLPFTSLKMTKKELGRETINGRRCVKQNVMLTDPRGNTQRATTWEVPELKNFPIRVQLQQGNFSLTMDYRDVNLSPPDAASFQVPSGYKEFPSIGTLMQEATQQAMQSPRR